MRGSRFVSALLVMAVGAAVACSSNDSATSAVPGDDAAAPDGSDGGGGGGEASVPPEVASYVDALCAFTQRCIAEQGQGYESEQVCKTHWSELAKCRPGLGEIAPSVIVACTAYLKALTCGARVNAPGSPCAAVFQGGPTAAANELCYREGTRDHLCESGSYCPDPARSTCSKCTAQVGVGADCVSSVQCDTEFCGTNGKCQLPIAAGQACASGAPCAGFRVCAGDTCKDLKAEGASCSDDSECFIGAYCLIGKCKRIPACARTTGQRCDGTQDCAGAFYCQGPSFTCQPRVPISGSCVEGLEACVETAFCDVQDTTCKTLPAVGQSCAASDCPAKSFCNAAQQCEAQRPDGAVCDVPGQCLNGACRSLKCGC